MNTFAAHSVNIDMLATSSNTEVLKTTYSVVTEITSSYHIGSTEVSAGDVTRSMSGLDYGGLLTSIIDVGGVLNTATGLRVTL